MMVYHLPFGSYNTKNVHQYSVLDPICVTQYIVAYRNIDNVFLLFVITVRKRSSNDREKKERKKNCTQFYLCVALVKVCGFVCKCLKRR